MVYLFVGKNSFAMQKKNQELVVRFEAAVGAQGFVERLDVQELSPESLVASITALPFLTPNRLIFLRNALTDAAKLEKLVTALDNIPTETLLVISAPEPDKRTKGYKQLLEKATLLQFEPLTSQSAPAWVTSYVEGQQGVIDASTARFLVDYCGSDQQALSNNIGKLLAYDQTITRDSITLLCQQEVEQTIFMLTDKLARGDLASALKVWQELQQAQVAAMYVITMIGWQTRNILAVSSSRDLSDGEIAKAMGMSPYVVQKTRSSVSNIAVPAAIEAHVAVADIDHAVKTGDVKAEAGVTLLLARIAESYSGG